MAHDGDDVVKHLIITGVKPTDRVLGRRGYTGVFVVDYNGVRCAAKGILMQIASTDDRSIRQLKQDFLEECLLHSKLHHPNIVKMLGVYYPNDQAVPPVLVMEMMECNLTQLLDSYQNIPMYVKLSILQDVSRAICYLHTTLNPPMMHCNLNPYNILLTASLMAKVRNFELTKVVSPLLSGKSSTQFLGHFHFMPPEISEDDPLYGLPLDVFSFGCVVCHVISQQWPIPTDTIRLDSKTNELLVFCEVERRQHYIDQISEGSLKQLVIKCLDNFPEKRPPILVVSEGITSIITG